MTIPAGPSAEHGLDDNDPDIVYTGFKRTIMSQATAKEFEQEGVTFMGFDVSIPLSLAPAMTAPAGPSTEHGLDDNDTDIVFTGFKRTIMSQAKAKEFEQEGLTFMGFDDRQRGKQGARSQDKPIPRPRGQEAQPIIDPAAPVSLSPPSQELAATSPCLNSTAESDGDAHSSGEALAVRSAGQVSDALAEPQQDRRGALASSLQGDRSTCEVIDVDEWVRQEALKKASCSVASRLLVALICLMDRSACVGVALRRVPSPPPPRNGVELWTYESSRYRSRNAAGLTARRRQRVAGALVLVRASPS